MVRVSKFLFNFFPPHILLPASCKPTISTTRCTYEWLTNRENPGTGISKTDQSPCPSAQRVLYYLFYAYYISCLTELNQRKNTHTFSALPSLAVHCSVLYSRSCFFEMHSSYFACKEAIPSSTSASLALAASNWRWVSCNSSWATLSASYNQV